MKKTPAEEIKILTENLDKALNEEQLKEGVFGKLKASIMQASIAFGLSWFLINLFFAGWPAVIGGSLAAAFMAFDTYSDSKGKVSELFTHIIRPIVEQLHAALGEHDLFREAKIKKYPAPIRKKDPSASKHLQGNVFKDPMNYSMVIDKRDAYLEIAFNGDWSTNFKMPFGGRSLASIQLEKLEFAVIAKLEDKIVIDDKIEFEFSDEGSVLGRFPDRDVLIQKTVQFINQNKRALKSRN